MKKQTYTIIRILTAITVAIIAGASVAAGNYAMPFIIALTAMLLLYLAKQQVKDVLADERDYEILGKASRIAISAYSFLGFLAILLLLAFKGINPYFEAVAYTLAYSICFLMIIYSFIFKYYSKDLSLKKNSLLIVISAIILFAFLIFGMRLFSGEDDWICQKGEWVKHGNPDFPAPEIPCTD